MNPEAASGLGIADGDWVWIETPRGRVRQKCRYFDGIDPRVVNAEHGWWFPEEDGAEPSLFGAWKSNINQLIPMGSQGKDGLGAPIKNLLCKVYRA